MARTYGPLGPRGESRDPAFTRALALAALASRRGPAGAARARGDEFDFISGPARERYARSLLDERLRGMIADRESVQAGPGLARRGMGLQERSLEEQIRSEMAGEGLQSQQLGMQEQLGNRRLGMEEQFGADRRLGMEREFGLGMRGADLAERGAGLAERSLTEQMRAALADEAIRREQLDVTRTTGGSKDPEGIANADAIRQQATAGRRAGLTEWIAQPHVQARIGKFIMAKDIKGAVDFIINENPFGDVTPDDVRRVMSDVIGQITQVVTSGPAKGHPMSDVNAKILDHIMRLISQETAGR